MFCERHLESWLPLRRAHRHAIDLDSAARWRVEPADQVQQRRLAGAGRPHQRQKVALRNIEVHAFEHFDALAAAREVFVDVSDVDEHSVISGD